MLKDGPKCPDVSIDVCGRMRKRYDPRVLMAALEQRNTDAQAAAKDFAEALADGRLDPASASFNQGADEQAAPPAVHK